ncbi:carboxylesterase family protein [Streptomyces sp. NWU339]|uniref:carboxylesterase family protein n=1 Tax=Streptomyces sp. NWU339 TaxID=2185284 RepID=UPI0035C7C9BC
MTARPGVRPNVDRLHHVAGRHPLAGPRRPVEGCWRVSGTSWAGSDFRTTSGPVRGRRPVDGVVAVLGVPYAAAPFGPDCFREPQPGHGWSGPRDCTVFGPVAP